MSRAIPQAVTAELVKLGGLPAVVATALGTVGVAVVMTGALAASPVGADQPAAILFQAVPYLQAGMILLGVLTVGTEYTGDQIRTALICVPDRWSVLTGKLVAYLTWAAGTAVATVLAGLLTADVALAGRGGPTADAWWPVVGASAYLVLIGLLAQLLAVLTRALLPALVGMLCLVFVLTPVLRGVTGHARYLPDVAGGLLYRPGSDDVLTPATGLVVLLGWLLAVGTVAVTAFLHRDA
ncbi:hypothetical protein Vqi01_03680 [Micromonospora qiuiae]|uniref:ABC transporter permease n=1 Tax=Micromonospora qiuiae TaxID=502268 RepID=A0ABQ4J5A2_9ACTN|nr:hypothetical protein [Micromonospora qiuiae]GIJ25206.1 hypothetical protein Vqi01_03680 [Micromonospora qiuiae]